MDSAAFSSSLLPSFVVVPRGRVWMLATFLPCHCTSRCTSVEGLAARRSLLRSSLFRFCPSVQGLAARLLLFNWHLHSRWFSGNSHSPFPIVFDFLLWAFLRHGPLGKPMPPESLLALPIGFNGCLNLPPPSCFEDLFDKPSPFVSFLASSRAEPASPRTRPVLRHYDTSKDKGSSSSLRYGFGSLPS